MKFDRHIHTPYCPHGTADRLEEYIIKALKVGLESITFTEHAPLPEGFDDPTPDKDSGMDPQLLEAYFDEAETMKQKYKGKIEIRTGLEVDYIEGFERETKAFLDEYGPRLDDSILSVHFIKNGPAWHCIDFSAEEFGRIAGELGSVEDVYKKYYETVESSIRADLGPYKPGRIGHMTLVHKFQHLYPAAFDETVILNRLLSSVKEQGYALDYNAAGLSKTLCLESYPPGPIAREAARMGIPLIPGSDAHRAEDVGKGLGLLPYLK